MRNRIAICLAATVAACSGTANNNAADGNGANAAAANTAAPEPAGSNAAEANTAAAESAEANAAWANATAGNEADGPRSVPIEPGPDRGANYRASGTEPVWTLTIGNGMMNYQYPGGGAGGMTPEPTPVPNGLEFRTPMLTARFTERPCTGASSQTMRYTVRVTVDGRTVNGCGQ